MKFVSTIFLFIYFASVLVQVASGLVVYAKHREAERHFKTLERNSEIALAARAEIVLVHLRSCCLFVFLVYFLVYFTYTLFTQLNQRKDKNQGVNEALINQAGLPLITQTYLALGNRSMLHILQNY